MHSRIACAEHRSFPELSRKSVLDITTNVAVLGRAACNSVQAFVAFFSSLVHLQRRLSLATLSSLAMA